MIIYPSITFTIGMLLAPGRALKAFKRGYQKPNVYKLDITKEELMKMNLSELKAKLKLV